MGARSTDSHRSTKGNTMTSTDSQRRTEIGLASLWLITAAGAIAGTGLMESVLNTPDYLTTAFPQSTTVIIGMLLWLINDFGIVFIGLLMFSILKQQSERIALSYLSMRMFEALFLVVGVILGMMLIPLSQSFLEAGATDATNHETTGAVLKQAQYWFMTPMQHLPLGLGGVILTLFLYRTKLVPRFISVVGLIGYGLLIPGGILILLGALDISSGSPGSLLVIPVATFEILLMPIWLCAKGFNRSSNAAEPAIPTANPLMNAA